MVIIWLIMINNLVGSIPTPLKNDGVSSSVGMMKFPLCGRKNHVPNHQADKSLLIPSSNIKIPSKSLDITSHGKKQALEIEALQGGAPVNENAFSWGELITPISRTGLYIGDISN